MIGVAVPRPELKKLRVNRRVPSGRGSAASVLFDLRSFLRYTMESGNSQIALSKRASVQPRIIDAVEENRWETQW